MPDEQSLDERRHVLRRLRGEVSLRAFAEHLAGNGLAAGRLSRHRLGEVERGVAELPDSLWDEIAEALIAGGHAAADVAALWSTVTHIEPAPPSTARQRLEQWTRVAGHVRDNRWWRSPLTLVARVTPAANLARYQRILERYGVDRVRHLRALRARLELGAAAEGRWRADPDDGIAIDRARSVLTAGLDRAELFLLRFRLHNTGQVPWRDRMLYRIGPPVTTATPFTPGVLPVPDTGPGQTCEVLVPGRAQWFRSRAVISFVMVFPDLTACLPGRVCCWIDTRGAELDRSLPLLPGFPGTDRRTTS